MSACSALAPWGWARACVGNVLSWSGLDASALVLWGDCVAKMSVDDLVLTREGLFRRIVLVFAWGIP